MGDWRKSRRSSILKPPKPRNPLSDVDLNPPSIDATFMKSRRVSFANSNFIKEFTADPEKNTIWHNSYEEVVNKSEDSKNSEQQTMNTLNTSEFEEHERDEEQDQDEFNCTKAGIFDDNSFETPLLNSPLETSVCSSTNMDLTVPTNDVIPVLNLNHPDKTQFDEITQQRDRPDRPLPSQQCNSTLFDQLLQNPKRPNALTNMEITGSIPANSNLMKNILKCKLQQQLELRAINKENEPYCNEIVNRPEKDTQMNYTNCNMDLTQTVPVNFIQNQSISNESISESVDAEECSMEITQTVPTSITTNLSPKRSTMNTTMHMEDNDMETTQAIPGGIQFVSNYENSFNNKINLPDDGGDDDDGGRMNDMEFTQAIPTGIHICKQQTSDLKHDIDNMEFTAAIPSNINFNINIKSMNSNNCENVDVGDINMEFTQAIPSAIKLNNLIGKKIQDNMEMTAVLPTGIKFVNDQSEEKKYSICERNDLDFTQAIPGAGAPHLIDNNKSQTNEENMEFTQAIPGGLKCLLNNRSKLVDNMELTASIPDGIKLNRKEEHNTDMEFTQAIPGALNLIDNNKSQTNEDNMEFTQAIPGGLKSFLNNRSKFVDNMELTASILDGIKLIHKEEHNTDMEFTQAIPGALNLIDNNKSQTNEDNMEFTQAIPSGLKCLLDNRSKLVDNMELTASIPDGIKLIRKEEHTTDLEFTQAIPGAINLIDNNKGQSNENNMEFSQAIPSGLNCLLDNRSKLVDNMELTAAIPGEMKLIRKEEHTTDMEFTQALPGALNLIDNNKSQTNEDNMEFTQAIPASLKCLLNNRSKLMDNINMELTAAIPDGIKLIHKEEQNTDMEFTQAIPSTLKLSDCIKQIANDMEMTTTLPSSLKLISKNTMEFKTEINDLESTAADGVKFSDIENDNMEFTRAVPNEIKLNNTDTNNDTFDGIKEKDIPNLNETKTTEIRANNTESINNSNSEYNIEFSEAIPDTINLINKVDVKENEIKTTEEICTNHVELTNTSEQLEQNIELPAAIPGEINKENDELSAMNKSEKLEEIQINSSNTFSDKQILLNDTTCSVSFNNNGDKTQEINNDNNEIEFTNKSNDTMNMETTISNEDLNLETDRSIEIQLNESEKNDLLNVSNNIDSNASGDVTSSKELGATVNNEDRELDKSTNEDFPQQDPIANFANILHLKGYPLIVSPDPNIISINDSNRSDICLRIKYPGDDDDDDGDGKSLNVSEMEMNCSKESFSINKISFVDSTEKLINYQINYSPTLPLEEQSKSESFSNKRRSSENSCDLSNIPKKIVACDDKSINSSSSSCCSSKKGSEISSPNISYKSDYEYENETETDLIQDENIAWKSMVEKSFINNEVLSTENVSLINSFDSSSVSAEPENPENAESSSNISISDYMEKIIQKLKEAIEMSTNVSNVVIEDDSLLNESKRKSTILRKRFDESFKTHKHQNTDFKDLTLEQKIKQKSKDAIWNIVQQNDLVYTFNFMYETIVFDVHVAENSENVSKIEFYSQFCEKTSDPSAIYVHNILKKKLVRNYITSALGEPYNVISLLDLITMTGEQMLDILNEFEELECRHGVVLNNDLKAQIEFFDLHLPIAFEVTVNIKNIENISSDDVSVNVLVGEIDENAIKKLIHGCPQGIQLLRTFIVNVEGYIKFLKSIKRKKH